MREALCSLLCRSVGISTPRAAVIDPHPLSSIEPSTFAGLRPGLLFGSEVPAGSVFDYLPTSSRNRIENLHEMLGWPVFDLWLGNRQRTQAVFARSAPNSFRAYKISHAQCLQWAASRTIESSVTHSNVICPEAAEPMEHLRKAIIQLSSTSGALETILESLPREFGAVSSLSGVPSILRQRAAALPLLMGRRRPERAADLAHRLLSIA